MAHSSAGFDRAFAVAVTRDLDRLGSTWSKDRFATHFKQAMELKGSDPGFLSVRTITNRLSGNGLPVKDADRFAFCDAVREHLSTLFADANLPAPSWRAVDLAISQEPSSTGIRDTPAGESTIATWRNYSDISLDDWQYSFWQVYGPQDQNLRLNDMMLQLVVDSTRLTEAIRKNRYDEALVWLPRVFSWMCSMSIRAAWDCPDLSPAGSWLAGVVWAKYPGVCCLCAQERCICPTWDTDLLSDDERRAKQDSVQEILDQQRRDGERPETLDEWIEMFDRIYGTVNATRPASTKVLHFWEEIGELEVELRRADRLAANAPIDGDHDASMINWEGELADVFSWLSATYLHIKHYLLNNDRLMIAYSKRISEWSTKAAQTAPPITSRSAPFSEWVWAEYGNHTGIGLRCHKCKHEICDCTVVVPRR